MNNDSDRNYISVGFWMWMMFVTAIPVIGWIMVLVWAIAGDNESRKNYFRAILMWIVLLVTLVGLLALLGYAPAILKPMQSRTHGA